MSRRYSLHIVLRYCCIVMMSCTCCPRHCDVDRRVKLGFCHASMLPEIASVSVHKGEEPPISGKKGIVNIFFAHCNLQCCFCQNRDISGALVESDKVFYHSADEVVGRVAELLPQTENVVGFVSPSHYAWLVPEMVEAFHAKGMYPTIVYNTNGYDTVDTLRMVAPYVDIYLPDFKYMDASLAQRYSHAADYPQRAQEALIEMLAQKGTGLPTDENDIAFRGIIVRHLVLPGQVQNSIACLQWMADNLSTRLHVSLMAQYYPPQDNLPDQLNRTLLPEEYNQVVAAFHDLGFTRGWVQELSASETYHPDFSRRQSF